MWLLILSISIAMILVLRILKSQEKGKCYNRITIISDINVSEAGHSNVFLKIMIYISLLALKSIRE